MAGEKRTKKELILIYTTFMKFFDASGIDFVLFYGSLLGIIRDNEFIDGDDDIDVLVFRKDYQKLIDFIEKEDTENLIKKTEDEKDILQLYYGDIGPFDIYITDSSDRKLTINWEKDVYHINDIIPLKTIEIYGYHIQIPNYPEKILRKYYGFNWYIPIDRKQPVIYRHLYGYFMYYVYRNKVNRLTIISLILFTLLISLFIYISLKGKSKKKFIL